MISFGYVSPGRVETADMCFSSFPKALSHFIRVYFANKYIFVSFQDSSSFGNSSPHICSFYMLFYVINALDEY